MKKKYIIFDFDGTLVNTNDIIIESWQATYEHYLGHKMDVDRIVETFGEVLNDTIARTIPDADLIEVRSYYRDYQDTHCQDKVYAFEGVRELLDELRRRGYCLGVATSRTAYSFKNYMDSLGLTGYIDEVVTVEDVSSHKPDPESVIAVLEKFGADPEDALMIGDTKYDIGCANNAGVDSVLVGWSHYVDEEAMAADGFEPTHRIRRPDQLLGLV